MRTVNSFLHLIKIVIHNIQYYVFLFMFCESSPATPHPHQLNPFAAVLSLLQTASFWPPSPNSFWLGLADG